MVEGEVAFAGLITPASQIQRAEVWKLKGQRLEELAKDGARFSMASPWFAIELTAWFRIIVAA